MKKVYIFNKNRFFIDLLKHRKRKGAHIEYERYYSEGYSWVTYCHGKEAKKDRFSLQIGDYKILPSWCEVKISD